MMTDEINIQESIAIDVATWLFSRKRFWQSLRHCSSSTTDAGVHSHLYVEHENIDSSISHANESTSPLICSQFSHETLKIQQLSGFTNIGKFLRRSHPKGIYLTLFGATIENEITSADNINPSYCAPDNPLPNWMKEIVVRTSGKTIGDTSVSYVPPDNNLIHLRNKQQVEDYLRKTNLSSGLVSRFDFRSHFCVCLSPSIEGYSARRFMKCSFGLSGCREWMHADCVGLGALSDSQIATMAEAVCPLCTWYLEGAGMLDEYAKDKILLREVTLNSPPSSHFVADMVVQEFSRPHSSWGITSNPQLCWVPNQLFAVVKPKKSNGPSSQGNKLYLRKAATSQSKSQVASPNSAVKFNAKSSHAPLLKHRLLQNIQIHLSNSVIASKSIYKHISSSSSSSTKDLALDLSTNQFDAQSDSDESDDMNTHFNASVPPRDRFRFAKIAKHQYVKVKVTGGWMRMRHCKSSETESSSKHSAKVSNVFQYDTEIADRIRNFSKAGLFDPMVLQLSNKRNCFLNALNHIQMRTANKRFIMNAFSSFRSSLIHDNDWNRETLSDILSPLISITSIDDLLVTKQNNPSVLSELLESLLDSPTIDFVPLEDGGARAATAPTSSLAWRKNFLRNACCAVSAGKPTCDSADDFVGIRCGFCLSLLPLKPTSSSSSSTKQEATNFNKSRQNKKRTIDNVPPPNSFNMSESESAVVTRNVGSEMIALHRECNFLLPRLIATPSSDCFDANPNQDAIEVFDSQLIKQCDAISLSGYYRFDESFDSKGNDCCACDLCGIEGGLLRCFKLRIKIGHQRGPMDFDVNANDSSCDFLLGHIPCLHWLSLSLNLQPDFQGSKKPVFFDSQDEDSLHHPTLLSQFFGCNRCVLCGGSSGFTWRCVAVFCSIRVHPLCAFLAENQGWRLGQLSYASINHSNGANIMTCLCPLHSNCNHA